MKKIFLMLGTALLALTSCSESEVLDVVESNKNAGPIGFSAWVGKQTRAEVTDNTVEVLKGSSDGKDGGFYLMGGYVKDDGTKQTLFAGGDMSVVRYNGTAAAGSWQYASIVYYWQEDANYRFAAFAPKLATLPKYNFEENTISIDDFVADGKTDLLVASATDGGTDYLEYDEYVKTDATTGATTTENIKLAFRHALAKVRFEFINKWHNAVTVQISNIRLQNVKTKASLKTYNNLQTSKVQYENWSTATQTTAEQVAGLSGSEYVDDTVWETDDTDGMYPFENFLIPQDLTNAKITLTFKVKLTYTGYGQGPDIAGPDAQPGQPVNEKMVTATLPLSTVTRWLPGNKYTYRIGISADMFGLRPIKFELVSVDDWTSGEAINVEAKSPSYNTVP